MGSGSDLVYRVVLGWRFGPVPNRTFAALFASRIAEGFLKASGFVHSGAFHSLNPVCFTMNLRYFRMLNPRHVSMISSEAFSREVRLSLV